MREFGESLFSVKGVADVDDEDEYANDLVGGEILLSWEVSAELVTIRDAPA